MNEKQFSELKDAVRMVARHAKGEQITGMRLIEVPETDVKAVCKAANADLSPVRLAYHSKMPVVFR